MVMIADLMHGARRTADGSNKYPLGIHGRPRFARHSVNDSRKVEIAATHPDFDETVVSVPDGIR